MAPDTIIERSDDVMFSDLGDEFVAMDVESGDYYNMKSVAARIWEGIAAPIKFQDLCAGMVEIYDVSPETCAAQVETFLSELVEAKLIKLS